MAQIDIILDSACLREWVSALQSAKYQLEEAVRALHRAGRQTGWNCPERHEINARLSELSQRLGNINARLEQITSALGQGAAAHDAWEQKALQRKNALAANLQNQLGFCASTKNGGKYTLPTSPVPKLNLPPVSVGK